MSIVLLIFMTVKQTFIFPLCLDNYIGRLLFSYVHKSLLRSVTNYFSEGGGGGLWGGGLELGIQPTCKYA